MSILTKLILSTFVCSWTLGHYGDARQSPLSHTVDLERGERFIAAVDWLVDQNPEFVWPFASMQPASYNSVRIVVESMPWIVQRGRKQGKPEPLIASTHLKINGRLRKPDRIVRGSNKREKQEFLVKLEQGRLRLTLILPTGAKIDSRSAIVKLKLYEA